MSNFNPLEVNFDDTQTWDLICSGRTKGVFQLESNLGKSWAKRVQPKNIEELSALMGEKEDYKAEDEQAEENWEE